MSLLKIKGSGVLLAFYNIVFYIYLKTKGEIHEENFHRRNINFVRRYFCMGFRY